MNLRRKVAVLTGALLLVGAGVAGGGAAYAAPPTTTDQISASLAVQAKAADDRGYIVVDSAQGEPVGDAVFYPTGPIAADTLVVIADAGGTLPNGLTQASLDSLVAQKRAGAITGSSTEVAAPAEAQRAASSYYAWSASSSGWSQGFNGGSLIGWDDTARASYYFYTAAGFNQRASGNGLGYYRGYNGSTFGTWSQWYYVGIAGSGGAGATTPWGNVAATKQFRALCTQTTVCWGDFQ